MYEVEQLALFLELCRSGQKAASAHAHFALNLIATDDNLDIRLCLSILFSLSEAEAWDQDFLVFSDDEIFVPCVCDVWLSVSASASHRYYPARVFDALVKDFI